MVSILFYDSTMHNSDMAFILKHISEYGAKKKANMSPKLEMTPPTSPKTPIML